MKIFVKSFSNKTFTLDVGNGEFIESVKAKIADIENIPADQQNLIFEGKQLVNGFTVEGFAAFLSIRRITLQTVGSGILRRFTSCSLFLAGSPAFDFSFFLSFLFFTYSFFFLLLSAGLFILFLLLFSSLLSFPFFFS
jgi:hypothetical protein